MLKILIAAIAALPKVKKLWSCISDSLHNESLYAMVTTVVPHLSELQQEDSMVRIARNERATSHINIYSAHLGESWLEVERVFSYEGKPYIPETL